MHLLIDHNIIKTPRVRNVILVDLKLVNGHIIRKKM